MLVIDNWELRIVEFESFTVVSVALILLISSPLDHLQIISVKILVQFIERNNISRVIHYTVGWQGRLYLHQKNLNLNQNNGNKKIIISG